MRLAGHSYGSSLAYPHRTHSVLRPNHELLGLVLDSVHPANLGPLPPSPERVALKGEQIGLGSRAEFFTRVWF